MTFRLRCPSCGRGAGALPMAAPEHVCPCEFRFETRDGIIRALTQQGRTRYSRFLEEYSRIRALEGRGSSDRAYYLALPFRDLTGKHSDQWMIRSRTYLSFEKYILQSHRPGPRFSILDLGAGNGWLSYRMASRGHHPVAIDLRTDAWDGLGAARHFAPHLSELFPRIEAEIDSLPFEDRQFDLAVFNASFHYSTDYAKTVREALRCLKSDGRLVILDTPLYRLRAHGVRMREESHAFFERQYGFRSDSVASIEFLDAPRLDELAREFALRWKMIQPWYGWRWHLRPLQARLNGRRPPSRFCILVGAPDPQIRS